MDVVMTRSALLSMKADISEARDITWKKKSCAVHLITARQLLASEHDRANDLLLQLLQRLRLLHGHHRLARPAKRPSLKFGEASRPPTPDLG